MVTAAKTPPPMRLRSAAGPVELRAQAEAQTAVPERFRPNWKLAIFDKRLKATSTAAQERSDIRRAKLPDGKDRKRICVFDGDGFFSDDVVSSYDHQWMWGIGGYKRATMAWSAIELLKVKATRDFIGLHLLSVSVLAGRDRAFLRRCAEQGMQRVFMPRAFNVTEPYKDKKKRQIKPFFHPGSIKIALENHERGGINILATGSRAITWEAVFDGMHDYVEEYRRWFKFRVPKRSLMDFVVGARPVFDKDDTATYLPEYPLTIGNGKRVAVEALLAKLDVDPKTVKVYSDDVWADRPLLQMTTPEHQYAVNVPLRDEALARAFDYQILRTDGRERDNRTAETLQILHEWRKAQIAAAARKFLER